VGRSVACRGGFVRGWGGDGSGGVEDGDVSKILVGIRGVPMRKIVSRVPYGRQWIEMLKCGHTHLADTRDLHVAFRRCYMCRWEKERDTASGTD
jgi:hypothetical protein